MRLREDRTGGGPAGAYERFRSEYLPLYAGPMAECERRLARIAARPGGSLGGPCSKTLAAGGKRLRPLLVFLSTRAGAPVDEPQYAAATAIELVHMATLVHDDVIDNAELRRGQQTLFSRYGPSVSTSAGDYLFSCAFEVLAQAGSPEAAGLLAGASLGLSRGELIQMRQAYDYGLRREDYVHRCDLKTSGLFSAACRLGAMLSGCSGDAVRAMGEYGHCLGLAFQITDDILDYAGEAARLGKRIGTDLRDGTVTLPLIIAIGLDGSLEEKLEGELTAGRVEEICSFVEASGALELAARAAYGYVEQAKAALEVAGGELDTRPLGLVAEMAADRSA